jgi:hypothetical protein
VAYVELASPSISAGFRRPIPLGQPEKVPLASCCLHLLNQETSNDLEKSEESLGVSGECSNDADCPFVAVSVASFGSSIAYIAERWPSLPPHIRDAILVDDGRTHHA